MNNEPKISKYEYSPPIIKLNNMAAIIFSFQKKRLPTTKLTKIQ